MTKSRIINLGILLGVAAVVFATVDVRPSWASRNSGGTYSLPAGNPVTSGTTISSTWANGTLNDIATTLTASLDRSGKGPMLAVLKLYDGASNAPGLTFNSEQSTGLYRATTNDVRLQVASTTLQKWTAANVDFPLGATIEGSGNEAGLASTGGSTGNTYGVAGYGGSGGNGVGLHGQGTGTGYGGDFFGGLTSGGGLYGEGGTPNGTGGSFNGAGTGYAVNVGTGNAHFAASNPASTTGFSNVLTPVNVPKAWVRAASSTVYDGFNIASAGCGTGVIAITMAQAMADTNYAVTCSVGTLQSQVLTTANDSTTIFRVAAYSVVSGSAIDLCNGFTKINCTVFGRQ